MPPWAKWLLLACGGVLLLGLLLVGGCVAFVAYAVKRGSDFADAWREMVQQTKVEIHASPHVRERVGEIHKIETHDRPHGEHPTAGRVNLFVTGTKGEGRATVTFDVSDFTPVVRSKIFRFADERFDLATGAPVRDPDE